MVLDVKKFKVAVVCPDECVDKVREGMCKAGAGVIGDYSFCTMATRITGSFIGNDNTNPYVGEKGKLEFEQEIKLEAICTEENIKSVLKAIREVHPYEEPGIDIYPLVEECDL